MKKRKKRDLDDGGGVLLPLLHPRHIATIGS